MLSRYTKLAEKHKEFVMNSFEEEATEEQEDSYSPKCIVKKRSAIIVYLTQVWLSHGVTFGDVIGRLKPKSKEEGKNFLVKNKYFLLKSMYSRGFQKQHIGAGIVYLTNSFWNMYKSETIASDFIFKHGGIVAQKSSFELDKSFGIDFFASKQTGTLSFLTDESIFFIVKSANFYFKQFFNSKPLYRLLRTNTNIIRNEDNTSNLICNICQSKFPCLCSGFTPFRKIYKHDIYVLCKTRAGIDNVKVMMFNWHTLDFENSKLPDSISGHLIPASSPPPVAG